MIRLAYLAALAALFAAAAIPALGQSYYRPPSYNNDQDDLGGLPPLRFEQRHTLNGYSEENITGPNGKTLTCRTYTQGDGRYRDTTCSKY